jgi:hypothetical protein
MIRWSGRLASERLLRILLALNALATLCVFFVFRAPHGGDLYTYVGLADGILHGRYSFWWDLPMYIPDTFRNPGYPLFLAAFRAISGSLLPVQIAQALMYAAAVVMILRIIGRSGGGTVAKNIFLLLLLPSFNFAYYNTGIFPETPVLFLITLFVYVETGMPESVKRSVMLALIAGVAFQFRSTLLLLPLAWIAIRLFIDRRRFQAWSAGVFLGVFVLTTVPYSLWNLRTHGVYKPTPLESGGGVLHIAWWSGRIPGHQVTWYWNNRTSQEIIDFVPPGRVPEEIAEFDAECHSLDSALAPLLTRSDSIMLDSFRTRTHLFRTYNTRYTLERERLLKAVTFRHMEHEPAYTATHTAYTAVRLWVTGLQPDLFAGASTGGKLSQLYPFALTLGIFLLALVIIPATLMRNKGMAAALSPIWLWLVYFGVLNAPFVIQARYTIPVRLLLIALLAICIERTLGRSSSAS